MDSTEINLLRELVDNIVEMNKILSKIHEELESIRNYGIYGIGGF